MAKTYVMTCDMCGELEAKSVQFSTPAAKNRYIDLCPVHQEQFANLTAEFVRVSRTNPDTPASRGMRGPSSSKSAYVGEVRAWALTAGHSVSDRGRIPANVYDAYEQTKGSGAAPAVKTKARAKPKAKVLANA
jgi:Lsr2